MTGSLRRLAPAIAMLVLLALAWRGQFVLQYGPSPATGAWTLLAATLAMFAVWLLAARGPAPDAAAPSQPVMAREWLAAGAVGALGVGLRVVHFTTVPAGMNHDAAFNGMYALHVLQGAPYTPYVSAAWGRETLFMYLCTPFVAWLGNVPEPMQIAATLVGIATLPPFYLLARALCGPRVALLALGLLAVSGWHTLFSRVGWRMIMVPPFEILALLGLWRALATHRWRDWILTGAGMALAIYTYDAGRIVPPMIAVLLVVFSLRERAAWRARLAGGLCSLAVFLLVGGVMLGYAATHFEQFKARATHLAESEHPSTLQTLVTAAAMFNYRGNGNDFFVREPLLEPLAGALFGFAMLVTLAGTRRRAHRFILLGLVLAILPGVLSVPNGNRCIAVLPFVYLILALGLDALAGVVSAACASAAARRAVAVGVAALVIAVGAVETYREFLGAERRPIIGFSPEATAGGEYLRRFGADYTRYVVAEDWPEYTLAYLSYNGGGTPLENHYILGRRLEEIEDRINRYGRRGLVFATDLKPAGQQALERLRRLFAEHRVEPILSARLGGAQVGTALIVEPQGAARAGLWSNTTRALSVGGAEPAAALRCFEPVGDAGGATLRLQLMLPERGAPPHAVGEVAWLAQCPPGPKTKPLLAIAVGEHGLAVRGERAVTVRPWNALEAGRWYEISAVLQRDGTVELSVDGERVSGAPSIGGPRPPRVAGLTLAAAAGGHFFVDALAVVPGTAPAGDPRWSPARRPPELRVFEEDFESTPYGLLAAGGGWQTIDGMVSALASPGAAAHAAAVPADGGSAFDGGHGAGPGQFDQPIGIAIAPSGELFVADKNNHRIQKFARDGSFLLGWGRLGNQPGEFREPHDVAADAEFVYVADTWNQRVQVFDHAGQHVFTITGQPSFSSPRGISVHEKLIYVAEAGGGRVTVYDRAGTLRQTIGTLGGEAPGHLIEPVDVAVDEKGDVWVVNSGNNRVEHFAGDGTPIGTIPVEGWTGPGLKEVSLAFDARGTLYLTDWELGGVRRYRRDGSDLPPLGSALRQPSGIGVTRDRALVVSRADDVVRVLPLQ